MTDFYKRRANAAALSFPVRRLKGASLPQRWLRGKFAICLALSLHMATGERLELLETFIRGRFRRCYRFNALGFAGLCRFWATGFAL